MRGERWATALFFAANGATYGSIFARLPELVDRYGLTPSTLGVVLFVPVLLSLVGSMVGGRIVVRFGARMTCRVAALGLAATLALTVATPFLAGLLVALAGLGLADGVMDVGMNMHAIDLEDRLERPLLQGLHAAWTAGALAASIAAGFVAGVVSLGIHFGVAGALVGLVGVTLPGVWEPVRRSIPSEPGGVGRTMRVLALVAVGAAFVESIPIDWASVFTAELFSATPGAAASATVAALAGMLVGRLAGDPAIHRFGSRATVVGFSLVAAIGGALAGLAPSIAPAYAALFFAGLGSSVIFPALVSIAGRVADGGVAVVTSAARVAFMLGPLATGAIADRLGFRPIMVIPAVLSLAVAAWARTTGRISDPVRPSA